jgi:hypothetical protein
MLTLYTSFSFFYVFVCDMTSDPDFVDFLAASRFGELVAYLSVLGEE